MKNVQIPSVAHDDVILLLQRQYDESFFRLLLYIRPFLSFLTLPSSKLSLWPGNRNLKTAVIVCRLDVGWMLEKRGIRQLLLLLFLCHQYHNPWLSLVFSVPPHPPLLPLLRFLSCRLFLLRETTEYLLQVFSLSFLLFIVHLQFITFDNDWHLHLRISGVSLEGRCFDRSFFCRSRLLMVLTHLGDDKSALPICFLCLPHGLDVLETFYEGGAFSTR